MTMARLPWTQKRAARSADDDEEEEEKEVVQKATAVELFSDLVFVVAMHIIAEPIEAEPAVWGGVFNVYILRVLTIWWLWHSAMMFTNLANLLYEGDDLRPSHHALLFVCMTFITLMAQSAKRGDDLRYMIFFLGARLTVVAGWTMERGRPRPEEMSTEDYEHLMKVCKMAAPFTLVIEVLPFSVGIGFGSFADTVPPATYACWVTWAAVLFGLRSLMDAPRKSGAPANRAQKNVFSAEQMAERYELIMLIVTGEIVFAAAVPMPSYYLSLLAMATAALVTPAAPAQAHAPGPPTPCLGLHAPLGPTYHSLAALLRSTRSASCCTSRRGRQIARTRGSYSAQPPTRARTFTRCCWSLSLALPPATCASRTSSRTAGRTAGTKRRPAHITGGTPRACGPWVETAATPARARRRTPSPPARR